MQVPLEHFVGERYCFGMLHRYNQRTRRFAIVTLFIMEQFLKEIVLHIRHLQKYIKNQIKSCKNFPFANSFLVHVIMMHIHSSQWLLFCFSFHPTLYFPPNECPSLWCCTEPKTESATLDLCISMHKVWKFLWNFSVSTNYEFVRFEYVVANRNEWKISIKIFLLSILVGNDICKIIWSFYEEVQSRSDPQIQV